MKKGVCHIHVFYRCFTVISPRNLLPAVVVLSRWLLLRSSYPSSKGNKMVKHNNQLPKNHFVSTLWIHSKWIHADHIAQGLAEEGQDLGKSSSGYLGVMKVGLEWMERFWMELEDGRWNTEQRTTLIFQFDQPGKKKSRRVARSKKALASGAAPLQRLRPAVRCPTQRYNIRIRGGLICWRIWT